MGDVIGKVCETRNGVEWEINDFLHLSDAREKFFSHFFPYNGQFWELQIYPNGNRFNDSIGYIELYLVNNSDCSPVSVHFSLALKTAGGKKVLENHFTEVFEKRAKRHTSRKIISRSELLKRKTELLPSGILTVVLSLRTANSTESLSDVTTAEYSYCKGFFDAKIISMHEKTISDKPKKCPEFLEVFALKNWYDHEREISREAGDVATEECHYCKEKFNAEKFLFHEKKCTNKPIKCPECADVVILENWYDHQCKTLRAEGGTITTGISVTDHHDNILQDLKQLFLKQENSDVILRVQNQEFLAHKAILTARSPVFATTFRHEMKEKDTGIVDIEECDPSIFPDFLRFLYCGDLENLSEENVFELLTVSDKYDVPDLRKKCVEFMKENLSVGTFCETMTLALQLSENEVINFATEFFGKNAPKIIVTVKWQNFLLENPIQSNELFIKFSTSDKISKV